MSYIKQLFGLAVFFISVQIAVAQPSLRFWGVEAAQGDLVYLEFRVVNFTDITRLHIPFFIPTDQLMLESIDGIQIDGLTPSNFTAAPQQFGQLVTLDWYSGSDTQGESLPQGGVLFRFGLRVLRDCGVSTVNIWPGATVSSVPFPAGVSNATVYGGNVNITGCLEETGLVVAFSDAYGGVGDTVCVQVSVENFEDILAIQYSLEYDVNSLALYSIEGFNLPGLTLSNFGFNSFPFIWPGSVANSWTDPDVVGLSMPDGANIYDLCFEILPGAADTSYVQLSQVPTITEAIDGDETVVRLHSLPGKVILGPPASNLRVNLFDLQPANCAQPLGGSVDIVVSGGQFPYSYLWNGPNGFSSTSGDLSQLAPGHYELLVTDQTGATATLTADIDFIGPLVSAAADTTICQGGTAQLSVVAASGSTFAWSPAAGLSCADCPNPLASPTETTAYICTITDQQGCTELIKVTVAVRSYPDFGLLPFSNSPVCAGDTLFLYPNFPDGQAYTWGGPNGFGSTDPAPFIPVVSALDTGNYTLSVLDPFGCTVEAGFEVHLLPEAAIQHTVIEPDCFGDNVWILNISVNGAGPFSYSWNTGADTQDITISEAGEYVLSATDGNGCVSVYGINPVLSQPTQLEAEAEIVQLPLCVERTDGAVKINTTGGMPPYTYSFSNGATPPTNEVNDLSVGTYVVSVTDAKGCMAMTTFTLTPLLEQCSFNFSSVIGIGESQTWCSTELTEAEGLIINPGACAPPDPTILGVTYENDGNCAFITGIQPGADTICWQLCRVSGACVSLEWYISAGQAKVWPGDFDNNGLVDHYDLLPLGLVFGATGPQRNPVSAEWEEQFGPFWPEATPQSGINYAYVDADGDGEIGQLDGSAMFQNLYLSHDYVPQEGNWSENAPGDGPSFYVETTTVAPGEDVTLPIILGAPGEPMTGIYGLAFNLHFDSTWVRPGSAFVHFSETWLGDQLFKLSGSPDDRDGIIQSAIIRIDHQNQTGQGTIGTLKFQVLPNAPGNTIISFRPSEVRLIDQAENLIPVNALTTETSVISGITNPELKNRLRLYPNPTASAAWLEADPGIEILQVNIHDLTGKVVRSYDRPEQQNRIELNPAGDLVVGIYMVEVKTPKGVWAERLVVVD